MAENPPPEPHLDQVPEPRVELDPDKLRAFQERLKSEQRLGLGILAGAVAALVGAGVWAVVTVVTSYQIGWMAVGVGFLVGFAIRAAGKGISPAFGIAGAVLSLLGCILGNLLSISWFASVEEAVPYPQVVFSVLTQPAFAFELLRVTFSPMDILFYAIAVYFGYRFAIRQVTQEELAALTRTHEGNTRSPV